MFLTLPVFLSANSWRTLTIGIDVENLNFYPLHISVITRDDTTLIHHPSLSSRDTSYEFQELVELFQKDLVYEWALPRGLIDSVSAWQWTLFSGFEVAIFVTSYFLLQINWGFLFIIFSVRIIMRFCSPFVN